MDIKQLELQVTIHNINIAFVCNILITRICICEIAENKSFRYTY